MDWELIMNIKKIHQRKKKIFLISGVIIPLFSLTFSYKGPYGNLILVTFSQIGARYGAIEQLILWGIMSSIYYFFFLSYLFEISGRSSIALKTLLSITCMTLLITVFLPYAPTMFPVTAKTHNYLAYITASSIVTLLLLFIISLYSIDKKLFLKSLITYFIFVSIVVFVLLYFGVSSLFQIVLSISMCILMFALLLYLENCEKINIYTNIEKNYQEKPKDGDIF